MDEKIDKIQNTETNKHFDENLQKWIVVYTENHLTDNGKEKWDWSSIRKSYFDSEVEANTKLEEINEITNLQIN